MFRISRLHEIMKGLPRGTFDRIVDTHRADKHTKGFGCWDQLLAMVYAQLAGANSLRVLEAGFNSQGTHHYHLATSAIRRSTLADALSRRPAAVFAEAARWLMAQAGRHLRREGEELLYVLDSTSITLTGPGFDAWTQATRTRHTQGIKLHVLYENDAQIPVQHRLTAPNVNDIDEGARLPIKPGAVYVFDKGYCDYNWWSRIDAQKALFVTRFKRNAALRVERALPIAGEDAGAVLSDEIVRFANKHPRGGRKNHYHKPLRRVTVARPEHDSPLVLATNDLDSPAAVIARRYRERWAIELFFKWIKQHLRIKRFLGRSENAVRIQILTALITYLLLALYRQSENFTGSLWTLLSQVRATLFQRPAIDAEQYRRRKEAMAEFASRQGGLFAGDYSGQ
jgi:putative transposase